MKHLSICTASEIEEYIRCAVLALRAVLAQGADYVLCNEVGPPSPFQCIPTDRRAFRSPLLAGRSLQCWCTKTR